MGARNGMEVAGAQFELKRSRKEAMLAKAASHLLGQVRESGLELIQVGGVLIEGVFMANGFGVAMLADVGVKPPAGILSARLAGEGEPPFSKVLFENAFIERGKIADEANAEALQV